VVDQGETILIKSHIFGWDLALVISPLRLG
jgi:hypothetical protein